MSRRGMALASTLLLIHNGILVVWGLFWIIAPEMILSVSFISFAGRGWDEYETVSPTVVQFMCYHGQLLGVQFVLLGSVFTTITLTAFKRGKRWAWIVIALCSTAGWIYAVVFDVLMGVLQALVLEIIPLLIVYCSLIISAKPVLSRGGSFDITPSK